MSVPMKRSSLTIEHALYALMFLLATFLRLYHLGSAPLTDDEASLALQALRIGHAEQAGEEFSLTSQPAYVLTTALFFFLLPTSDFMARITSAVCGVLMLSLPFLIRKQLGRRKALLITLGMAIDPGLVATSRFAAGPIPAMCFSLLALVLWQKRKPTWAGVSAGLASLFGMPFVHGVIILAATWLILYTRQKASTPTSHSGENTAYEGEQLFPSSLKNGALRQFAIFTMGTILLGSTGFLRFPEGLPAWLNTWIAYIQGWFNPSPTPALRPLVALIFYQPLTLLLATIGLLRRLEGGGKQTEPMPLLHRIAYWWTTIGIGLTWLYPGREVMDITWVSLPLWILACDEIELLWPSKITPVAWVQGFLTILLMALLWQTLISPIQTMVIERISWELVHMAVLLGILSLITLIATLVSLSYSWELSRTGLSLGVGGFLVLYTISAMWGASQKRMNQPQELWTPPPATGQVELLLGTLYDLSKWNHGTKTDLEVMYTISSPALTWYLRDFSKASYVNHLTEKQQPEVVITSQESEAPLLAATYRGQDFVWWIHPGWSHVLPPDMIRWLAFREAPLFEEEIILWARSDLFPGGVLETTPSSQLSP